MTFLGEAEPALAQIIEVYGGADPFEWHDGGRTGDSLFAALALHIIGQQISALVAFRLYDRVAALGTGVLTPRTLLAAGRERLAGCGLSAAKARYLVAFAESVETGDLDFATVVAADDDEAIAVLTGTPGIGVWTAQTFLIHQLHRPDVWPSGEIGIRRAIAVCRQLEELPTPARAKSIGEDWRPYRSFAAALLWRSLYPPGEPSDPKERALLKLSETSAAEGATA
jgi:3-methyladenine DNA glycosylase/8-oxoguanine DNA glycosylase